MKPTAVGFRISKRFEGELCSPSPREPPPGVVSGENVTLSSSVIVLHREAIPTMGFSGLQLSEVIRELSGALDLMFHVGSLASFLIPVLQLFRVRSLVLMISLFLMKNIIKM